MGLNLNLNYKWYLKDLPKNINGPKVFSTFSCGGGSTMGYKLAGCNVLGNVEIDPKIMAVYRKNHNLKYSFLESIVDFNKRSDIPEELFDLDILDGSPPCSSFSTAGAREKLWGKKKKFREGQANQVLDDLFFHYIETLSILKPKYFIAENVTGILQGNAKGYVKEIVKQITSLGYSCQIFQLNAAKMGVPQKRERVFFIGTREKKPRLKMSFNQESIYMREIFDDQDINHDGKGLTNNILKYWKICKPGNCFRSVHPKKHLFNSKKLAYNKICLTIDASSGSRLAHPEFPRVLSKDELKLCSSFPLDFNFLDQKVKYICGMSVPPLMTANIVKEMRKQWEF